MKLSVRHLNFHLFIVYDLYPTADLASKLFVMAQYTLHHIDAHCCCGDQLGFWACRCPEDDKENLRAPASWRASAWYML